MVICEKCGHRKSYVLDSVREDDTLARRRRCNACGFRWTTIEVTRTAKVVRLTRQQIDHLLDVYGKQGGKAARALAPIYGISKDHVRRLAAQHGVRAAPRRAIKMPKRLPAFADPRWDRAKRVGTVVA